jgi:peptide/nickel transport system ATP-binding protein
VLVRAAAHPYTRALLDAVPRAEPGAARRRVAAAQGSARTAIRAASQIGVPAVVEGVRAPAAGCAFAPRCPFATDRCRTEAPLLRPIGSGHRAACHHAERVMQGEAAEAAPGVAPLQPAGQE